MNPFADSANSPPLEAGSSGAGLPGALKILAASHGAAGRLDPALEAVEEATGLYRDLVDVRPEAFRAGLADALSLKAALLGDAGRDEAGLATAEEAVAQYRLLGDDHPHAQRPGLGRGTCSPTSWSPPVRRTRRICASASCSRA